MKKILKRMISVMLVLMMTVPGVCAGAAAPDNYDKVEVWRRTDIILHSEKKYENAYTDVDIDAVFTHEDGTEIHLYGFWNGGDEWRVRFSPTKTGKWDYAVTCTDVDNASLNKSGSLLAVENTGKTDIDKHGFVKISDNKRYFVYDDGTPFYWLGDTNWQAPNYVSITECNYPGCDCKNQFTHEINNRLSKGFTVYQTYFDSGESDGGGQRAYSKEPSMWTKKYSEINPESFTNKYDYMFDYLADNGMVIALGFGVHENTVKSMGKEALDRLSRYLTARYASYPVVWITAQEITGEAQFDAWVSSARIVDAGDGYGHPQSAHQYPLEASDKFVQKLDKEKWHGFYTLQNGHGPAIPKKSTYKDYYNSNNTKPFVEAEANYEDIYCGGFNSYSASRISAWKANLCGSCGFTYGVTGIWANCWSTAGNAGWLGSYSTEPWYMGLDKPGSYEMKYMAEFFKYADFSTLVPRFNGKTYSDFSDEEKLIASSDDAKTYVAYFYNSDLSTGTVKGLNKNEKYAAKWYDPLTGAFSVISDDITSSDGTYKIPDKPNGSDWAFIITSRTDLYGCEAAPLPELEQKKTVSDNVLSGAKAKASSESGSGSSAGKAVDNNKDTWWCASDGTFPQWIRFDMKEEREFNRLLLKMYPGTSGISCTVECSDDGKTMRQVFACRNRVPDSAGSSAFTITLDKTEKCRYIKITFKSVNGNWAAVVDAEAYCSENTEVSGLPSYGGELQTPKISCVGGCIYDKRGNLTDTSDALADNDINTEWQPFAAESTQTILLDMNVKKRLCGLDIILGQSVSPVDFRVTGSVDGERWTLLSDTGISGLKTYKTDDRNALSAMLSGEYRYVKIILMGAPDKSMKKNVAEIKLYAETTAEEPPAKETGTEFAADTENVSTENESTADGSTIEQTNEKRTNVLPYAIGAVCAAAAAACAAFFILKRKKSK